MLNIRNAHFSLKLRMFWNGNFTSYFTVTR